MTYAKRLQIEYDDINEVATRIEVWQDGYTGDVETRNYASGDVCCEVAWGNKGTKKLPCIYGSKVTLYFDSETNFEFHDFFTSNSRKNKILVYKNGNLFHVSYGEADTWSEPFVYPPYEVSFTGYDGLGLLDDVDFLDSNLDYYEGELTPLEILQLVLSKTGLDLPLNTAVSMRPNELYATEDPLVQVLKDVACYQDFTCKEVLEALFHGCRIYQRGGEWWCVSNDKWGMASGTFSYYRYTSAGVFIDYGTNTIEFDGFWIEGDGEQRFLPALKQMTIVQDYGFKSNLILNPNFEDIDGTEFEGWTAVGVTPQQRTYDSDGNKYVYLPGVEREDGDGGWYDGDRTKYMRSVPVKVSASDSLLKISLRYALMGPEGKSAYVFYGLRLVGDDGVTRIVEAYKNNDVDGRVAYRWKASNLLSPIPCGAYIDKQGELEPETVKAYPYNKVADHFTKESITIDDGIIADGTLYLYLFLAHTGSTVAGSCFREVSLGFTDENDEDLPTEIEMVLINDSGNNYVPDDLELPNGDLPDYPNNLTIYTGGFKLNDSSGEPTTLWKVDNATGSYTYAEMIARFIASEMKLPRLVYKLALADSIPGTAMVITDPVTETKKFIEAGITYNDRMQTIDGRYVELVELDMSNFTVGQTISYSSSDSSSSSSGGGGIDTDEKAQLVDTDLQKTGATGYFSTEDFESTTDSESGITVYRIIWPDTYFIYVAYASDASGTGWSLTPTDALKYRAEIHSNTELTPVESDFSGATWEKYLGDDGEDGADGSNGTNGEDGDDGQNAYLYVAYASDNAGSDWSLTPTDALKYRAEIQSTVELTPVESDFASATWVKYIGDDGEDGSGGTGSDTPELHLDFEEAGDEFEYCVPYDMKFTSQSSENGDATLSIALDTDMARYTRLNITATAAGMVSLYGEYVTI